MQPGNSLVLLIVFIITSSYVFADESSMVPDDPYAWLYFSYETLSEFDISPFYNTGNHEADLIEAEIQSPLKIFDLNKPINSGINTFQAIISGGFKYDGAGFDGSLFNDMDLYHIILPLDIIAEIDKWFFNINITPGIFTDFNEVDTDDFKILAAGYASYKYDNNFQFGFGLAYDSAFGEDSVYPMGGVIWDPNPRWRVSMILPYPRITFSPSSTTSIFWEALPTGGNWNVEESDSEYHGDYDFTVRGYRTGLGTELQLKDDFWIHASAGIVLGREYEFRANNYAPVEADVDNSIYFKLGIVVR
ncbi:DUF6268 family outer membrane beta-barrel protein [bacterium]|nr:DUF6268 family outer membrane beta-barrel protein [bacterium]